MERLARFGFGARGVVYIVVGALAALAAIGQGGDAGGSRSALAALMKQPFGAWIVAALGLGLGCFALWRVVEAVADADGRGSGSKALGVRFAHLISGGVYAGLAFFAVMLSLGRARAGNEDQAARDWTAWLLSQPFGRWMVAGVAVAVAGTGIAYGIRAWRGRVMQHLSVPQGADWACTLGRIGFAARGLVFVIIGGFLLVSAWYARSGAVKGLGGALDLLREQPYGAVLLFATAFGLACFGAFGLVQARYRRVEPPRLDDMAARAKAAIAS